MATPADRPGHDVFYDSALVEEAVLLAESRQNPLRRVRFRRERDGLYDIDDPEARERAFARFHRSWFARLELGRAIAAALAEHPSLGPATRRCVVSPALKAGDEGADLRDERPLDEGEVPGYARESGREAGRPTIVIQIRAGTLIDPDLCRRLLQHELLHLSDMLDPDFGYRRELPPVEGGPARLRRVMDRYRVLWDCTIDGRLHRAGRVGDEVALVRRREFEAAFPELGPATERAFRRWFAGPRPTHDRLATAARDGASAPRSGVCPLCSFPNAELLPGARLPGSVRERIRVDSFDWHPEQGICAQCLELYVTRAEERVNAGGGASVVDVARTGDNVTSGSAGPDASRVDVARTEDDATGASADAGAGVVEAVETGTATQPSREARREPS